MECWEIGGWSWTWLYFEWAGGLRWVFSYELLLGIKGEIIDEWRSKSNFKLKTEHEEDPGWRVMENILLLVHWLSSPLVCFLSLSTSEMLRHTPQSNNSRYEFIHWMLAVWKIWWIRSNAALRVVVMRWYFQCRSSWNHSQSNLRMVYSISNFLENGTTALSGYLQATKHGANKFIQYKSWYIYPTPVQLHRTTSIVSSNES